ncbi:UNVERIFIED_CONTAM: Retrovirus-related Pol polyprotein from transposon RE2 [Sesamum latifolium]|uniref:Retrovirus-related Pol polyprotein from transposon RE2 n=1 Tax=Sesamum latifolium TaxID=2727402 RepID=A0AAW2VCN6_9LAMI
MFPPEGYNAQPALVCHLKRSLYGLKQTSRQWNSEFTTKLLGFGFHQSSLNSCLFIKTTKTHFFVLIVYVDDILLTGISKSLIQDVKNYVDSLFTIKDHGNAKFFLGLEIARSPKGTFISQRKYVNDIILDAGLSQAKSVSAPLPQGLKLNQEDTGSLPNPEPY